MYHFPINILTLSCTWPSMMPMVYLIMMANDVHAFSLYGLL